MLVSPVSAPFIPSSWRALLPRSSAAGEDVESVVKSDAGAEESESAIVIHYGYFYSVGSDRGTCIHFILASPGPYSNSLRTTICHNVLPRDNTQASIYLF